jgi:DNA-binding protein H-NS
MSETLQELRKQETELAAKIARAIVEARSSAIAEIQRILTNAGMTNEDLHAAFPAKDKSSTKVTRAKAAPRYIDPDNAENTWVGRGALPRWIVLSGKPKEAFLVKKT